MRKITYPFKKKKKISVDVEEGILKTIDKLANLTETNRSAIIISLFDTGIYPLFRKLESSWQTYLYSGGLEEKQKKKVEKLITDLKKIEAESGIHQYHLSQSEDSEKKNKK